jgi:facilitated trehalose transporter
MYTVEIFQSTGPQIDPNTASIVIGIVQVVFVLLSMLLVDKLGRKTILIGSSLMMAGNLLLLGYFYYVKETNNGTVPSDLAWIPMLTLVGFIIAYSFGMGMHNTSSGISLILFTT